MNLAAMSFKVYNSPKNQRYLRDLFYRMARDEQLTKGAKGEQGFRVVVLTEKEYQELTK